MTTYREDARFEIRLALSAEFDADYDGDDDGFRWLDAWRDEAKPAMVRALFEALRADGRFDVIAAPRGASPDDTLEIAVRWKRGGEKRS